MKVFKVLLLVILLLSFTACTPSDVNTEDPGTNGETTEDSYPSYHMDSVSVEDVIIYFNEVCLDAEYVESGDPSYVQKWATPIKYHIDGQYTDEDMAVLSSFTKWLNTIDGFPGIAEVDDAEDANLQIYFTDKQGTVDAIGSQAENLDGYTTFWYNAYNEITKADVYYCTDIDQETRNSVILEEIYNTLGPIQDTDLRPDSVIYSEFSTPQELTEMDELIMKVLYHPQIVCGMDKAECDIAIRTFYN